MENKQYWKRFFDKGLFWTISLFYNKHHEVDLALKLEKKANLITGFAFAPLALSRYAEVEVDCCDASKLFRIVKYLPSYTMLQ